MLQMLPCQSARQLRQQGHCWHIAASVAVTVRPPLPGLSFLFLCVSPRPFPCIYSFYTFPPFSFLRVSPLAVRVLPFTCTCIVVRVLPFTCTCIVSPSDHHATSRVVCAAEGERSQAAACKLHGTHCACVLTLPLLVSCVLPKHTPSIRSFARSCVRCSFSLSRIRELCPLSHTF